MIDRPTRPCGGARHGVAAAVAAAVLLAVAACAPAPAPTSSPRPPSPSPGGASPTASAGAASGGEYVIGVRIVDGRGEFFDRRTGERFVPRGMNYIRVDTYHSTFKPNGPDAYDSARVEADLRAIADRGFNVVRVFLDHRRGSGLGGDRMMSVAYLENVVDFLRLAQRHGLYVMVTSEWLPDLPGAGPPQTAQIQGINSLYLTRAAVDLHRAWHVQLIRELERLGAPFEAVFAWSLKNELHFDASQPPFSLTKGVVTTAAGTYDVTQGEGKRRLLEDNLINWADRVRERILEIDPTALVTVGFFQPQDPHPTRLGDSRLILTSRVLRESSLDFIDLHLYPGLELTLEQYVENYDSAGIETKPLLMGETGAFRHAFATSRGAAAALADWQVDSCLEGFDGWLLWTWDSGFPELWDARSDGGVIADALAPDLHPDPCVR